MQDAAALEKLGTPCSVLVTRPFNTQARAMTNLLAMPGYEYSIIGHPMGSLNEEQVMARAQEAFPQTLKQLVGS